MLDGLRAVGALLVVVYHADPRLPVGGLGVLTFFVLSGFLITWLLLDEQERTGRVSLRAFYARRSLRIFPAFYAYWLVLTALLLASGRAVPWPQAISSLFYVSNYYQGLHGFPDSGYSHTWSLGIEEQFYLLWPAAFLWLCRRRLVPALIAAIVAIWAWRVFLVAGLRVHEAYVYSAFETRADHLLIGCLLAVVLRRGHAAGLVRAVVSHRALMLVPLVLLGGSVLAFRAWGPTYRNLVGFVVDPLLVATLIVQLLAHREHLAVRWLDTRPLVYLGTISYSIYLYQQLVIGPAQRVGGNLVVTIAAVIAVAALAHHAIEKPFLALKGRAQRGRRTPSRTSAAWNWDWLTSRTSRTRP